MVWRWKSKFYVIFRFFCFVVSHMNIYACKEDISCRNKGVFKTYVERDFKRPSLRAAPRALLFCGPAFAPSPSAFWCLPRAPRYLNLPEGRRPAPRFRSSTLVKLQTNQGRRFMRILLGLDVFAEELRIVEILVLDLTKSLSVEPSPDSAVICIIMGFLSLPKKHF